jgi:hypothetical protein
LIRFLVPLLVFVFVNRHALQVAWGAPTPAIIEAMEKELEEERKTLETLEKEEEDLTQEAQEFTRKSLPGKVGEAVLAGWKQLVILTFKGLSIVEWFTDPLGALKSYLAGEAMEELEISQEDIAGLEQQKQNLEKIKTRRKELDGKIVSCNQDIEKTQNCINANGSAVSQTVELAGQLAKIKDTLTKAEEAAAKSFKDSGEAASLLGKIGKNQIREVAEACAIANKEELVSEIIGLASKVVDATKLADEKFELAEAKVNACQSKDEWEVALSAYNEGKQAARQAASHYREVEEGEALLKKILSEAELARSSLAEPADVINEVSPLVESAEKSSKAAHSWVDEARKLLDVLEEKWPGMVARVKYLRVKADTISGEAGTADKSAKAVREALNKAQGSPEDLKKLALCEEITPPKDALDEAARAMAFLGMGGLGEGIPKKAEACLAKLDADEVEVPNLAVFDNMGEIQAVLQHAGLKAAPVSAGNAPSEEQEFKVAGQEPAPGTKVKRGSTVTVAVYQKFVEEGVMVPDMSVFAGGEEMRVALGHVGLVGAFASAGNAPSEEQEFKVAGQEPAPGTKVKRGSTVTVAVYQKFVDVNEAKSTVPNVVGLTLEQAVHQLNSVGLASSGIEVSGRPPTAEQAHRVYSQSPAAGEQIPANNLVALKQYGSYKDQPDGPSLTKGYAFYVGKIALHEPVETWPNQTYVGRPISFDFELSDGQLVMLHTNLYGSPCSDYKPVSDTSLPYNLECGMGRGFMRLEFTKPPQSEDQVISGTFRFVDPSPSSVFAFEATLKKQSESYDEAFKIQEELRREAGVN